MTKPFEGARLYIAALLVIAGFFATVGCTPPPSHIPPMCETPLGPVPCGVQKP